MKKFSVFNFRFSEGFTLIEILTAISLLAVIGAITIGVITITLRSSKKSDLLETARQDSDTALTQMVKNIRYSQSVRINNKTSCVSTQTSSSIIVTSITDQTQTTYACTAGTIKSDGVSLFDTNALTVADCSSVFTCTQQSSSDPLTITIQYTLTPAQSGIFSETSLSLPFESSVTLRNFNQ